MKKFIIAATAVVVTTLSFASTADAGWRHRHHGWRHHGHFGIVIAPRAVIYDDYCFVKKVRRFDRWGNMYIKKVRVCG